MTTFRVPNLSIVRRQSPACGLLRAIVAVLTIALMGNSIAFSQAAADAYPTRQKLLTVGISKRVKIRELNGSTVKGTLTAVNEDSFSLIPNDGGASLAIDYSQVAKVNRDGMPLAVKISIWVVVSVAVFAIVSTAIFLHNFH